MSGTQTAIPGLFQVIALAAGGLSVLLGLVVIVVWHLRFTAPPQITLGFRVIRTQVIETYESAEAIFFVHPETRRISECNHRAVELFEPTRKDERIGIAGYTLQRQLFPSQAVAAIAQEITTTGTWKPELEYLTKKGNLFWGNLALKQIIASIALVHAKLFLNRVSPPIKDKKGTITEVVLIVRDITQRPLAEERNIAIAKPRQSEMQMAELRRINQLKDDFLNTISHELGRALSNITMAVRLLEMQLTSHQCWTTLTLVIPNLILSPLNVGLDCD